MRPSARKPIRAPLNQHQDSDTASSTPIPTPTSTPTPTPTFTPTSASTPNSSSTPTPTPISTPASTSTPVSSSTPIPTPTPSRHHPRPPRPPLKHDTPDYLLPSDQVPDNTPSSKATLPDPGDNDFDSDFVHVTHKDHTEGPKDTDNSRGTSTATSSSGCDINFSSAFGASSSGSSELEHIDGLWGWGEIRGVSDAEIKPPTAKAKKSDEERAEDDTPHLLEDALALVAEAEASAAADLDRSASRPRRSAAASRELPTGNTPVVYPLGGIKHTFRDVYRKLRQNDRRMKKVQRKLRTYKAEIEYLKGKRSRIWQML